ncbi:MAG: C45 family peptidase [Desulfobaccales bacterium]|nr:C45 family peptidase [Desulfobaccales bacterium]
MRVIELWGSPEERGRQHGQALGAEIRRMRRALLTYLARVSLYGGALPLYALLLCLVRRFWPYLPERLKQEMRGVAAGAQVGLGTVLLINVVDDLANNTPRCSALAAGKGYTADGAYVMGRNLDYPLFTEIMVRLQTLFVMEPERGQALASLAWPGYMGVCTGINKAGVALAQLSAMSRERTLKGVPAALRFREALEEEGTVRGVAARILETPGTIGNNLMLCGPKEAAVLELAARRGVVRQPEGGLLTATNHYQSPAMQPLKGRFPPRPPFSPLPRYHFTEAYSQARDRRLRELAASRKLSPAAIQAILADAHLANPGTVVSAVFSPKEGILWVAQGKEPPVNQGLFAEIKLWG